MYLAPFLSIRDLTRPRSVITTAFAGPSLREKIPPYSFAHSVNLYALSQSTLYYAAVPTAGDYTSDERQSLELDEGCQVKEELEVLSIMSYVISSSEGIFDVIPGGNLRPRRPT